MTAISLSSGVQYRFNNTLNCPIFNNGHAKVRRFALKLMACHARVQYFLNTFIISRQCNVIGDIAFIKIIQNLQPNMGNGERDEW